MTPLDDVRALVLSRCPSFEPVRVSRADAAGLVLAADVLSTEDVPPFHNTAVDGYAVQAADVSTVPVELHVIGELAAGAAPTIEVVKGSAIRIMTGAPIPPGCDAVVMVEDTERIGDHAVKINAPISAGANIRRAGSDIPAGDVVFTAGTIVSPTVEGVLASVNAIEVLVHRRIRVGVISTGDELVVDGSTLQPGQIRESNKSMLVRLVEESGATAVDLGVVRDDEMLLQAALFDAINTHRCDVLVTSGGVSMGDYDVVKAVLNRIATMDWFQIAMKPAKPLAFGTLSNAKGVDVPVFGLPGNPVSSLVSFELIARPAIRTMMGFGSQAWRPLVTAVLDHDIARNPDGKIHFDRGTATWGSDGRVHVSRPTSQGSHQLASSALANALVHVPDGSGLRAGDNVVITFLG